MRALVFHNSLPRLIATKLLAALTPRAEAAEAKLLPKLPEDTKPSDASGSKEPSS